MNKLLILSENARQYATLVEASGLRALQIVAVIDDPDRVLRASAEISTCNIILGDPPWVVAALPAAVHLRWVQSCWAGVDQLCEPRLSRDYLLTGLAGIFGPQISEYVMTYLFALERQVFAMRLGQGKKRWLPLSYRPSSEIRLGIIGLGSIGRHLARSARGFGIKVSGLSRSGEPCEHVQKVYTSDLLAAFLKEPDYVVLTLPATAQTRHLMNAAAFNQMQPSAVLINVGRGQLVNQHDLVQALQTGVIGGAVLDVFEEEPLPASSPLWSTPNTWITPHTAALSFPRDIVSIFVENYRRFCDHRPLLHRIDFARGY